MGVFIYRRNSLTFRNFNGGVGGDAGEKGGSIKITRNVGRTSVRFLDGNFRHLDIRNICQDAARQEISKKKEELKDRNNTSMNAIDTEVEAGVVWAKARCITSSSTEMAGCRISRRAAHGKILGWIASILTFHPCQPAFASLIQYPVNKLNNTYFLIRAGLSEAEEAGYVLTNPVAKTSMTNALSEEGKDQVLKETVKKLKELEACSEGCWIWPGMASNSYQTAEMIAESFGIGRNRIVPEFSKLDARGVGALERGNVAKVRDEVYRGDSISSQWRPPAGFDGTPNESIEDVATRSRELLSLLETQYRGSQILIISPDSDNLSVLQASVLGVDLRNHGLFKFEAGEVRELELSTADPDYSSQKIPCPNPPLCNNKSIDQ